MTFNQVRVFTTLLVLRLLELPLREGRPQLGICFRRPPAHHLRIEQCRRPTPAGRHPKARVGDRECLYLDLPPVLRLLE